MTNWNNIVQMGKEYIRAITPVTGVTTNDYVEVIDLDTRWMGESNFIISNTSVTNDLTYKVATINDYGVGIEHKVTENDVVVSDNDSVILRRHARVKIYVKSTVAGAASSYQIDCIAGR